jgi:hypothetical protein
METGWETTDEERQRVLAPSDRKHLGFVSAKVMTYIVDSQLKALFKRKLRFPFKLALGLFVITDKCLDLTECRANTLRINNNGFLSTADFYDLFSDFTYGYFPTSAHVEDLSNTFMTLGDFHERPHRILDKQKIPYGCQRA